MNEARLIVITGVTRGLGRALAEEFSRRGHTVLGCGRSADLIDRLRSSYPARHSFTAVDVASDEQVAEWARRSIAAFGPPDLILNNAAIINANSPLWEITDDEFSSIIDVNVRGVANVLRHFVPHMVAIGKGIIVNFSSGWGRSTAPQVAPYCATKWAIEGMTQALAQELPPGMAAIPLNPGIINTEMLRKCFGPSAESYESPSIWAKSAVPFLLGLSARHNGESITVPT